MIVVSLGKAALMGGLAGLGAECLVNRSRRGEKSLVVAGVIVGVALQALALCFGSGAALGAGVGLFFAAYVIAEDGRVKQDDVCSMFLGAALVGAVVGGIFGR